MAMRVSRGYERNRPNYQELCEGVRPVDTAAPREAYTGLPHVRIDEVHHDPIVLDPGTIVGRVSWTGATSAAIGKVVPAYLPTATGTGTPSFYSGEQDASLIIYGSAEANSNWGLPAGASGDLSLGCVKPIGVIYQPIYSFILNELYTNYKRDVNLGIVTDYVIMIPATNSEEAAIRDGDTVVLGSGLHYGAGWANDYTYKKAGRYARYNESWAYPSERIVGRCLKKISLATTTTSTAGTKLNDDLANITLTSEAQSEFRDLEKVQTVPGLGISGSGTMGIPAWLLDARLDDGTNTAAGTKQYWALVILIRL